MKIYIVYFMVILLAGCDVQEFKNENNKNPLPGDWCFLDKYGNYNEAFFGDSAYRTYNKYVTDAKWFQYMVQNDSLYSSVDKRYEGMSPIAKLIWQKNDEVVIVTEFTMDTLYRLSPQDFLLSNSEPAKDTTFASQFYGRYERFLVSKGIITEEEAEDFRKNQKVPDKEK